MNITRRFGKSDFTDWRGYVVAVVLVALTTWLKYLAQPAIIDYDEPIIYFLAIAPTAILFGFGPAIFVCILSLVVFDYFFIPPLHTFIDLSAVQNAPVLLVFLVVGLLFGYLASNLRERNIELTTENTARRQSQAELAKYRDYLEDLVKQRTGDLEKVNSDLTRDITEIKKAEEALEESEKRFKDLANSLPEGVFEVDTRGVLTYANDTTMEYFGLTPADIGRGVAIFDFVAPELRDLAKSRLSNIMQHGDLGPTEYTLVKKDGTLFPALVHTKSIVQEDKVTGARGVAMDLTEQSQAQIKYQTLIKTAMEGFFLVDPQGHFLEVNDAYCDIMGYSRDELLRMSIPDVEAIETARETAARIGKIKKTGRDRFETKQRRKDGRVVDIEVNVNYVDVEGGQLVVFLSDITERKQREAAIAASETRYRSLFENMLEGFAHCRMIYDNQSRPVDFVYLTVNAAFEKLTGLKNVIGKNVTVVIPGIRESNPELFNTYGRVAATGIPEHFEINLVKELGVWLSISVYSSEKGYFTAVFDNITERKKAEVEQDHLASFPEKNPNPIIEISDSGKIMYANPSARADFPDLITLGDKHPLLIDVKDIVGKEDGHLVKRDIKIGESWYEQMTGYLAQTQNYRMYLRDITNRKEAEDNVLKLNEELKDRNFKLEEANKELQQFAYVASHDLREPLRMVSSFTQLLEKRYKDKMDKTANEYIEFIVGGVARMQTLIDDLLAYSRVGTRVMPFEQVNMENALNDVITNLKMAIEETGSSITHDSLPVIFGDPVQMMQVLQNLLSNAIKFHREGEAPVVHVSARREGEEWVFSVKDNGIGIDPELFGHLFNLFQRLQPKEQYPGTGIGLAVAKKIVQRHGGRIWVESAKGKGSTFYFSIPIRSEKD